MRVRWAIALLAVAALAWTTINAEMPWLTDPTVSFQAPPGAACPADAEAAKLNYTLKDVNNATVRLSSYKGKVILLDFWATWCGPCKVEIPWFIEFQQKYGKDGLQVVGISVDDTLAKLKPYVAEMKMTYPILQGLGHDDVIEAFNPMPALPTTVLISRDGKMCAKHVGMASKETFEHEIKSLLGEARKSTQSE